MINLINVYRKYEKHWFSGMPSDISFSMGEKACKVILKKYRDFFISTKHRVQNNNVANDKHTSWLNGT